MSADDVPFAVHEIPEPHAGSGSIRISVDAFTVNPTDTGVRAWQRDSSQKCQDRVDQC